MFPTLDCEPFVGFGPCRVRGRSLPHRALVVPEDLAAARASIRASCPAAPGIYGMIDADGQLVYVGQSKSLRNRLVSYFRSAPDDSKSRRIGAAAARLVWEPAGHELLALLRERDLICRWQPKFNVAGRPGRTRPLYICLGGATAPYAFATARIGGRATHVFGPIRSGSRAARAVTRVNDYFRLRDCPERVPLAFANQLELFGLDSAPRCLRADLALCLAPCAAKCTSRGYAAAVRKARGFLAGTNLEPLEQLAERMHSAAEAQQFELAGMLRDAWDDLDWLAEQLGRLRQAQQHYTFVYPVNRADGRERWIWLRAGQVQAISSPPRSQRSAERCMRLVQDVFESSGDPVRPSELDRVLLISHWFRKFPAELERTLSRDAVARQIAAAR